jgi:hypothetical protein
MGHYRENRLGEDSIPYRQELAWMAVLVGGLLALGQQRGIDC